MKKQISKEEIAIIIDDWVVKLRSGDYDQTSSYIIEVKDRNFGLNLNKINKDNIGDYNFSYCSLGVLGLACGLSNYELLTNDKGKVTPKSSLKSFDTLDLYFEIDLLYIRPKKHPKFFAAYRKIIADRESKDILATIFFYLLNDKEHYLFNEIADIVEEIKKHLVEQIFKYINTDAYKKNKSRYC